MQSTVFVFLFLTTAPIGLLPSILALFLRFRGVVWVGPTNLAVWLAFPLSVEIQLPFHISLDVALILWLFLLRCVLVGESSRIGSGAPQTVANRSLDSQ